MRGAFPWMVALVDQMKVDRAYIHDKFDPVTFDSDIALLRLSQNPVMVAMNDRKPPKKVSNIAGIPIFMDPENRKDPNKNIVSIFAYASSFWMSLLKCIPEDNSMGEEDKLLYLKYLSMLFENVVEYLGSNQNQAMCLPAFFINFLAEIAAGKPMPLIPQCSTKLNTFTANKLNLSGIRKNNEIDLSLIENVFRTFEIPDVLSSIFSSVVGSFLNTSEPGTNNYQKPSSENSFLSAILGSNSDRYPSSSDLHMDSLKCPPIITENNIQNLIDPRNRLIAKNLNNSSLLRKTQHFSSPPLTHRYAVRVLKQNTFPIITQTDNKILHHRACLPNPNFFQLPKQRFIAIKSLKTTQKINKSQKIVGSSKLKSPLLKMAPSKQVANSSEPVTLRRALRPVIRSTNSIQDTGARRPNHISADGVHNKASLKHSLPDARRRSEETNGRNSQRMSMDSLRPRNSMAGTSLRFSGIIGRKLRCVVLGWGQTGLIAPTSDVLRHAKVPIVSLGKCKKLHPSLNVTENMICAGDLDSNRDTCKGDSGGPLLCEDRENQGRVQWAVIGVTSFGVGCGKLGIYTNVARFTSWIHEIMKQGNL
ncbi:uncharacterized protein LOC108670741 [Hyalella azteca]|uniref:Uncharacterized protein LOC108670741 n=1 Tax=Hyalella azteca TaxID=294128 RepID=A0A8B7NJA3_HYAAZ|nr:uncharacterized protein LOC108670741 [Hyalella azteca]